MTVDELRRCFDMVVDDLADSGRTDLGYFEAGVFAGQSLATWWQTTQQRGVTSRMTGADSFKGLPASAEADGDGWVEGWFCCPRSVTEWNLRRLGVPLSEVLLVEGWFDESLTPELGAQVGTIDVAMLDADAYSSTVPVLRFLDPLLADVSWLIFDDWAGAVDGAAGAGPSSPSGVERAFNEWIDTRPDLSWARMGTYSHRVDAAGVPRPAGMLLRITRRS